MNDDARLAMAADALSRGNSHRALGHLREVDAPNSPYFFALQAMAQSLSDDLDAAESSAERGLAIDPHHRELLVTLADVMRRQDRLQEAERVILNALGEHPEDPGLLAQYAQILTTAGDLEKAHKVLDLAEVHGGDMDVLLARARLARLSGRTAEAEDLAMRALAADPESVEARFVLASARFDQNRLGQAGRHVLDAAELDAGAVGVAGREARYIRHPLMAPMRLAARIGRAQIWIGAIVLVFGLRAMGLVLASGVVLMVYLTFVVYSWTVPWLLRKWFQQRGRL